ncbi:hypothetical protein BGI15_06230 [Snodgrassella alvi]|uniref:hypothetical protein n=1 Tax=Snodgrassella TaxID=1193515 RepID=UPI000A0488DB|nr:MULTISPECIES: hypothetical protein [Snodgrassella]MBI0165238.1 hypothetical protein [Snodgrassella sp. M0351]ORF24065.1 hypothetical protein BGI07_09120 [Snodgrassella alvi]ORF30919.1 hypothetical protein BGI10_06960 [Snodgrassella alvi]ORF35807.1 hypothetical protein BGI11_00660 [Snodgrassella alvi]ORF38348.1 hypothetical protein BGI13_06095 [Snodgrassella alvi]
MRLKFTKIILMLAVAGMVSACGNKTEKSPDKMVRTGIQRIMTEDNQFNFSGSYQTEFIIQNNENKSSSEITEPITASEVSASEEYDDDTSELTEYHRKQMDLYNKSIGQFLGQFGKSFSVPFTGAVDMKKGVMEVIPEVRYEDKNVLISFKFPTYLDFNNLSLYLDGSAITHLSDTMPNNKMVIGDKYMQFAVPQDKAQHIPVADLLKSLPKSVDDGYASIAPSAFKKVNVDEFGKTLEAKYQVNLNTDYASSLKYNTVLLQSLSKALKETAAKADKNNKYKPEDYALLGNIIDALASIYSDSDNALADTPMGAYLEQLKNKSNLMVNNFYFDSKGRIIGVRFKTDLPMAITGMEEPKGTIRIDYKVRMDYTGSPKFTMQPTPQNSINIGARLGW